MNLIKFFLIFCCLIIAAVTSTAISIAITNDPPLEVHEFYHPYESELKVPQITFSASNFLLGEKIVVRLIVPDKRITFNLNNSLKVSRPIIVNELENYKEEFLPLTKIDDQTYESTIDINKEDYFSGEYQFIFNYSTYNGTKFSAEKTVQIGNVEIKNNKLDFSLLNKYGISSASLYIESSLNEDRLVKVLIIPKDKLIKESKLIFNNKLLIKPGKNEFFIKFQMQPEFFQKHQASFETTELKSKIVLILENKNNDILSKIAIPTNFYIGSFFDYNLEFIVITLTFSFIILSLAYKLWINNQPARLFGTFYCITPKNTKTYLQNSVWNLSSYNVSSGIIGTSSKAIIQVPLIQDEQALIVAKGKIKAPSLWIKPFGNDEIMINKKIIAVETQIFNNDDICIDGYLFTWKK